MSILFENEIAVVVCIKNEASYIQEWLEYHYKIGVDKFYIYNNDSDDTELLEQILEPWIHNQIVDYVRFPGDYAQMPAYIDCILKHRFDCRYLAFIDADEFIVPKNRSLLEILNECFAVKVDSSNCVGGLAANWRMFGANDQRIRESGGVLERFTRRIKDDFERNLVVKTIANPRRVDYYRIAHYPSFYMNCLNVNENGNVVHEYENPENTVEKIQINHYFTKSFEEFTLKKNRGRADCWLTYSDASFDYYNILNRDEVEDLTALKLFRKSVIRREVNRSDESTIRDIKFMLSESYHTVEQLLTCFYRANKLKDVALRMEYVNKTFQILAKIEATPLPDIFLYMDTFSEIAKSKSEYVNSIAKNCIQLSSKLVGLMRLNLNWDRVAELRKKIQMLEVFK